MKILVREKEMMTHKNSMRGAQINFPWVEPKPKFHTYVRKAFMFSFSTPLVNYKRLASKTALNS